MNRYLWLIVCVIAAPLVQAATDEKSVQRFTEERHANRMKSTISHYKKNGRDENMMAIYRKSFAKGSHAYVSGDFGNASREFALNTVMYQPSPEVLILIADAHFRAYLKDMGNKNLFYKPGNSCWNRYLFASFGSVLLREKYERAFDLVDALKLEKTKASPLYQRAYRSAACLADMVHQYGSGGMSPVCVDPAQLKECLGEPLMDKADKYVGSIKIE